MIGSRSAAGTEKGPFAGGEREGRGGSENFFLDMDMDMEMNTIINTGVRVEEDCISYEYRKDRRSWQVLFSEHRPTRREAHQYIAAYYR